MKNWEFYSIKQRCVSANEDNIGDPYEQGDIKSSQRYAHGKKLFDEIAANFASKDIFTAFIDVMRTVIITCTSGDPDAGFVRIKKYITVDPRFQKPKTIQPTLLPAVNIKQGRQKKNNRGKMLRELSWTPRQCTFCLSRNPVHRLGTKCKPLMAKCMNVELTAQNFPLISHLAAGDITNLVPYDGTKKPLFVHVLTTTPPTDDSVHEHLNYICTRGTLRKPEKRKEVSVGNSPIGTPSFVNRLNLQVEKLHKIWQKRQGQKEETWEESRIGRITGTTSKFVMMGKNKPTALQLSQLFGLSTFKATTPIQIGNIMESKILQAYCKHEKLQMKKERGERTMSLLYQYNYVGHTPDGKTNQSKVDAAEVLEVKVVFSTHEASSVLFKKNTHQLQLGLFVHRCNEGRMLVNRCSPDMSVPEAEDHQVDVNQIEAFPFSQDKQWFTKFKPNVEAFYADHLEWFYESTFNVEEARLKVEGILSEVESNRRTALLKKRKLLKD